MHSRAIQSGVCRLVAVRRAMLGREVHLAFTVHKVKEYSQQAENHEYRYEQ